MTRKSIFAALLATGLATGLAAPALADLPVGTKAPAFATEGALAGKEFPFSLKAALAKGPVVLYFYPKAFTQGCTLEAHAFAEATPEFQKLGATVIGMSNDDIDTLKRFSTEHCRDKFAVAAATPAIVKAYDVDLKGKDGKSTGMTDRTSYVIAQDGTITLVYSNLDYRDHVRLTLDAVKKLHHH